MIVVITRPDFFPGEAEAIVRLLDSGAVDRVHIRKPYAEAEHVEALLDAIPKSLYGRLSLHDCHRLAVKRGCGIHLNARNPLPPASFEGTVSVSCHSIEELLTTGQVAYRFISPVYPSISKPGYKPSFTLESLKRFVDNHTIALGGVTPDKFPELADAGLGGAALLGCVWNAVERGETESIIAEIKEYKSCFNS